MAKIEKLRDLVAANVVSLHDVKRMARAWFQDSRSYEVMEDNIRAPYSVILPHFDDLPEHVQGFIVKAILESAVEPSL